MHFSFILTSLRASVTNTLTCQRAPLSPMPRHDLEVSTVPHNQHNHPASRKQKRAIQMWAVHIATHPQGQAIAQGLHYLLVTNSHICIYGERWERARSCLMHLDALLQDLLSSLGNLWLFWPFRVDPPVTKHLQMWPVPDGRKEMGLITRRTTFASSTLKC